MKTLHLTNSWHATSGGIATFYRALMTAANERGHEMCLVVPGTTDKVEPVGAYGRIYSIASPTSPVNSEYRMILANQYLGRGSSLRQILKEERPDLVEICDKYTLNYFGGMLRVGLIRDLGYRPVVIGLSCERMDDNVRAYLRWNAFMRTLTKFYMKWLYFPLFDHHIANSGYTADELRMASSGHLVRRGVWIRAMGVDSHDFSPAHRSTVTRHQLLQRIGASADSKLLLYVGRLVPEKNLGLLLDTLVELRNRSASEWRLVVVGDGVGRQRFLKEGDRRAPRAVAWLGHVHDRSELARIYANCDVFVHPNPREPFGIAPLEAMASGLPVVAPNVGGVTTYASTKSAWLATPEAKEFASAIEDAIGGSGDRGPRITEALKMAAPYRWENVTASFLDLYEDLIAERGAGYRSPADFFSTFPEGKSSATARFAANLLQRLLAAH